LARDLWKEDISGGVFAVIIARSVTTTNYEVYTRRCVLNCWCCLSR